MKNKANIKSRIYSESVKSLIANCFAGFFIGVKEIL
jgi:hypothetical protein